jgi:hypothetical protein
LRTYNQNIDLKKNHELKVNLIQELKSLLDSTNENQIKYERFLKLRQNWVNIGKVPGHLAFGLKNSYDHQVKVFYDYLYLDRKFKEQDQNNNKKIKEKLLLDASKIEKNADKLKSYRELLIIIRKWNYQIGPVKNEDGEKLDLKFDIIIKKIKDQKKEYLNNREKFDNENLELKKELVKKLKNHLENLPNKKNAWIGIVDQVTKIKNHFINIGPIKLSDNDSIWNEFKDLNRKFIKEKNLFFKNLKKNYSTNIEKQKKLINKLEIYLKQNEKIDKKIIIEIRNEFKNINDVPFKKNTESWLVFNEIYNKCFNKINNTKSKETELEKDISLKQKKLKEELLLDFNIEKIDSIIDKWVDLGQIKSLKETNELIIGIKEKMRTLKVDDIEDIILKIKSKILNKNTLNSEKVNLKKKISDYQKQISQLENNLNFIKGNSDSDILSNVHLNIKNYKIQMEKFKKKLQLISKN